MIAYIAVHCTEYFWNCKFFTAKTWKTCGWFLAKTAVNSRSE